MGVFGTGGLDSDSEEVSWDSGGESGPYQSDSSLENLGEVPHAVAHRFRAPATGEGWNTALPPSNTAEKPGSIIGVRSLDASTPIQPGVGARGV